MENKLNTGNIKIMIDIGSDNIDNELNIQKNNKWINFNEWQYEKLFKGQITLEEYQKTTQPFNEKKLIDLRTEKEIEIERNFWRKSTHDKIFMIDNKEVHNRNEKEFINNNKIYNPKELEYWRNIFPTKPDSELEEYRTK